ncbi:hypothetical protein PGT21_012296 [Puccinia graminis f. sp. tritici]|uniref:F-box domain-containing protein n=1 Tax=Puccinia graminis f. sp. tritici TaxID=56615 RepID=A0A5B0M5H8_PUCGR|nr:hypothetical protein PGTUg99_024899 [Puccinia graminis f. sp. tritici]KAA1071586.1 hypothetical protein PGT21_012296 [Puccinia graminis f. sp. tritici]
MANILDLPDEVLDIIFEYLVSAELAYNLTASLNERRRCARSTTINLRLVCRKWADWFYIHHLYDALLFPAKNAYRKSTLIQNLTERSPSLAWPKCRVLSVFHMRPPAKFYRLRTRTTKDKKEQRPKNAWDILESLVELFAHSLNELDMIFLDFVSLPLGTIEAIGRIRNLRVLRLGIHWAIGTMFTRVAVKCGPAETRPDSPCLRSLIIAAQNLKRLDLEHLHPVVLSSTIGSDLANYQLPAITQLDLGVDWECSLDGFVSLAAALKPTLKVLTLHGNSRDYGRKVKPIFEILRETLEGISVYSEQVLTQVLDFEFPKLRVFATQFWMGCICELLTQKMFSYAPIEIIALDEGAAEYRMKRSLPFDPFANKPKLRRLILSDSSDYDYHEPPPKPIRSACKAHGIEIIKLARNRGISEMMAL